MTPELPQTRPRPTGISAEHWQDGWLHVAPAVHFGIASARRFGGAWTERLERQLAKDWSAGWKDWPWSSVRTCVRFGFVYGNQCLRRQDVLRTHQRTEGSGPTPGSTPRPSHG